MNEPQSPSYTDDILHRLSRLESSVSDLRARVEGIAAVIPYLATEADVIEKVGAVRIGLASLKHG